MEEGQGVEEHHQAMGQDVELNPELWETLPSELIDKIVDKVLMASPFPRVLSFCSVCQRWTDFLLSMEYLLLFHNFKYKCMLFNPRTDLWESMPLLFPQAEGLKLQHMAVASYVGGLLRFTSAVSDESLVFNPLTRRCRMLRGPNAARRICNDAKVKMRTSYPSGWHVSFREVWDPLPFSTQNIVVKISVPSGIRYFHLIMAKHYRYGRPSVTLIVKDSRRSKASVMLGSYACSGGFNVLFYDGEEQRLFRGLNIQSIQNDGATNRKTLFATLNIGRQLKFLELRDGGLTLRSAPFLPPTEVLRKNAFYKVLPDLTSILGFYEILNFLYVEHGDIVYYISLFRQSPRGQVNISVWTHILVNGLEHISNWMEWQPSVWESRQLPSSRNFFFFKPSFLSGRFNLQATSEGFSLLQYMSSFGIPLCSRNPRL